MRLPRRRSAGGCALLLAVLPAVLPPTPAAGAAAAPPPTLRAAQRRIGPQAAPPTASAAQRAAALATPAMVSIEVRWDGYLYDTRSRSFVDTAPVTISAWCPGVGVGGEGYLATTARCLEASTVVPDLVRATIAGKVADGTLTRDEADDELPELIENAVLVGEPASEDARRTIAVRRAVNGDGPLPASVVGHSDLGLVALVKIDKENQPMLAVADDDPTVGQQMVVLTAPAGYDEPVRPATRPAAVAAVTPRVLIPAPPTTAGSAAPGPTGAAAALPSTEVPGGVVVTQDGTLLGLVDGTADGDQVVIGAAEIGRELAAAAVDVEPGTVDDAFRDGLNALYAGNYTQAVESFDMVLAVIPSHASAHVYRDQAQALRAAQGGSPVQPGLLAQLRGWVGRWSGVLVGLGVLAAIVVFLVRRTPGGPQDGPDPDPDSADRSGSRENSTS